MSIENTDNLSPDEVPFEIVISGEVGNETISENEKPFSEKDNEVQTRDAEGIQHSGTEQTSVEEGSLDLTKEKETFLLLRELSEKFDKKIAIDTHKNGLFDKMYAELDSYKNDIYQKIMKPFVLDMIMLIDDTNKILRDVDRTDPEKTYKILSNIPDDLLEILERNGIEGFQDESEVFNAKTQRVLKTILTDNPDLDNKIESRIRQGYRWDGKVIRPEMIQCYKYSQAN